MQEGALAFPPGLGSPSHLCSICLLLTGLGSAISTINNEPELLHSRDCRLQASVPKHTQSGEQQHCIASSAAVGASCCCSLLAGNTPSGCGGPESFANRTTHPTPASWCAEEAREKLAKTHAVPPTPVRRIGEALTESSNQMCRDARRRPLFFSPSIQFSASNPPPSLSQQQQHPSGGKKRRKKRCGSDLQVRLRPRPIGCITKTQPNQHRRQPPCGP
ncbi:hypothetical protein QBC34DRAFT_391485 [Podospora aff. communis PSN243]|uniref:Uncharacterized protein n=1 Tax=Podospora aff. communis PSN243 TaxID=3040156 RepID=A0AAV9H4X5_9PEZI|nr:hypothetical protein QBC34DRAFT_391485 [Podospora aff. communis PSN243]